MNLNSPRIYWNCVEHFISFDDDCHSRSVSSIGTLHSNLETVDRPIPGRFTKLSDSCGLFLSAVFPSHLDKSYVLHVNCHHHIQVKSVRYSYLGLNYNIHEVCDGKIY